MRTYVLIDIRTLFGSLNSTGRKKIADAITPKFALGRLIQLTISLYLHLIRKMNPKVTRFVYLRSHRWVMNDDQMPTIILTLSTIFLVCMENHGIMFAI